ncbi:hypothetical protein TD95_001516, partial [Thielaviopsis punctulata]
MIVSLMSAAGNHCLQVAFLDAVAVYFWKRAFSPFPLANIHYYWRSAQGSYGAMLCIMKVTAFAILSIIVHTSTMARDPLFQNSIRISEHIYKSNGTTHVPVASKLDNFFAGTMTGRAQNVMITGNFSNVLSDYQQRSPILMNNDCLNCTFDVKAFGFQAECSTTVKPYDVAEYGFGGNMTYKTMSLFDVDINSLPMNNTRYAYLKITVSRKPTLNCTGNIIVETCFLKPAAMLYNLRTDNGIVTFQNSSWKSDKFLSDAPLENPENGDDGNLAAFQDFGFTMFHTTAGLYFAGARGWDYSHSGALANSYIVPSTGSCGPGFRDPMPAILNAYRELSLRTSLSQANHTNSELQYVDYTSFSQRAVYVIDYHWIIGGFLVSFVGVSAIMLCLWGFWAVGRRVSMSPLEMVKNFSYVGETHLRHFAPAKGAAYMAATKGDSLMVQWAVDKDNDCELTFVESKPPVENLRKGDSYNVVDEYE